MYVAGSNADDIGNQTGGWTLTWQGASGNTVPGTTILEGLRKAGGDITYSKDASAPTAGHDVGVVVVGETPVRRGRRRRRQRPRPEAVRRRPGRRRQGVRGHEMRGADRPGRPQLVGDRLDAIDALVASWLPGTEGDGVADVLYGRRPFTGQLPVTWPKSEAQLPINVGDRRTTRSSPTGGA
ncbi:glycoside hydrolase family 3 C-terminal domain-containing protein [Streptomyces tricolor]|nr:glycoside hydrolase family 3 C-terminal domain-containing protein [Streptomyces tricolor]